MYTYTGVMERYHCIETENPDISYHTVEGCCNKGKVLLDWIYSVDCFKLERKFERYKRNIENVDDIV